MAVIRQDTAAITVTIDGVDAGIWDTFSGGETDSEETVYRPGGMAPRVSLGGASTIGNVTVGRGFDPVRDDIHTWSAATGAARVVVNVQTLDQHKNPYGRRFGYAGTLKSVSAPEFDSAGNDPGTIELEITVDGGLV